MRLNFLETFVFSLKIKLLLFLIARMFQLFLFFIFCQQKVFLGLCRFFLGKPYHERLEYNEQRNFLCLATLSALLAGTFVSSLL